MEDKDLYRLIAVCAYRAYSNSLCGSPSPKLAEYYERHVKPELGDLVLETSSVGRRKDFFDSIGRLEKIEQEPFIIEDWPEDEETPMETVHYLKRLDGSEIRWTNASFIKIPEDFFEPKTD